jgi:hypothetical protein
MQACGYAEETVQSPAGMHVKPRDSIQGRCPLDQAVAEWMC